MPAAICPGPVCLWRGWTGFPLSLPHSGTPGRPLGNIHDPVGIRIANNQLSLSVVVRRGSSVVSRSSGARAISSDHLALAKGCCVSGLSVAECQIEEASHAFGEKLSGVTKPPSCSLVVLCQHLTPVARRWDLHPLSAEHAIPSPFTKVGTRPTTPTYPSLSSCRGC